MPYTREQQCFIMKVQALWEENQRLFEKVLRDGDWIAASEAVDYADENREPEYDEGRD